MLRIVEIKAMSGGVHKSQGYHGEVLKGYALIPEGMEMLNFPYGEVMAKEVNGVMTVTKWTPGEVPESGTTTPAQQREEVYNTQPIIEWEGELLTVSWAAQKWMYYAAEDNAKADELTVLIAAAKRTIREQYPDEEGSV